MEQNIPAKPKFSFGDLPRLFKQAFVKLTLHDPLRMAGATAFFTSFALPFILIILLQVLGWFIDPYKVRKELFADLSGTFGEQSVEQVVDTLIAFRQLATNWVITIFGTLFLLMVATTLLMVIKGSINQIWRVRVQSKKGVLDKLGRRIQSILIIAGTGLLFLFSIVTEAANAFLGRNLAQISPTVAFYFTGAITYFFSLSFVTLWFGILFRLLPDARPRWRIAFTAGLVTAILFNIGKFILGLLLTSSNLNSLYGASANVVLVLLFVFYSSLIMYFGASFTTVWADYREQPIRPRHYATHYKVTEIPEE